MQPNDQQGPRLVAPGAPVGPAVVVGPEKRSGDERPSFLRRMMWLVVLGCLAGLAYWGWLWREESNARQQASAVAVRTATVEAGRLERTLRVTGVTGAEKFVSLVAPQIRGSRSGRNRGGFSLAGMDQSSITPLPAAGGGSASGGGATGSAQAAGAAASVASTGGSSSALSGSMATLGATSRVASANSRPATRANTRSTNSGSSSALGSSGLGSTAGELGSGLGSPGGGPGGGDFTLVIQNLVKPGALVRAGQQVAEFDRQYMLQRLDDYRNAFDTAKAQLAQQKANLEMARYVYKQNVAKAKAALDKAQLDMKTLPVLSAINAERAKLALEEAELQYKQQVAQGQFVEMAEKAQLKYAEYEFKALEIEFRRTEQNAEKMVAKSPLNGMAVIQNTFRGSEWAQIQEGDQVYPGQYFMQIVDPKSMVINATVNQVDADRLRIGMKSRVRFDAYPGLEVHAHVISIAAVPKAGGFRASFVREIPVRLKIEEMDPRIIPDLSCSVDVVLEEQASEAIVPVGALQQDEKTGQKFVYIKNGEAWSRRDVEIAMENFLVASVRGVKPGETIALEPPPSVSAATGAAKG